MKILLRRVIFSISALAAISLGFILASVVHKQFIREKINSYVDPAIAVCLYKFRKIGRTNPGKAEFVSKIVTGHSAYLIYEVSSLGTKPIKKQYTCEFEMGEDQRWKLSATPKGLKECTDQAVNTAKEKQDKIFLENCLRLQNERIAILSEQLVKLHDLFSMEIYPIRPEETKLSN